jgi:hypothetical protein
MVPYWIVVLGATIVLGYRHVRSPHASVRSKWIVGGLTAATIVTPWLWPLSALVALPLQFLICLYVIFHRVVTMPDTGGGSPPAPAETVPSRRV